MFDKLSYFGGIFTDKREMLLTYEPNNQPAANQNQAGADNTQQPAHLHGIDDDSDDDVIQVDADPHEISTSNFIILQSSFECK